MTIHPRPLRTTPMTLTELTVIVLAAELSTRPQFRGTHPMDQRLQELAHEWIYRRENMAMRASVDDAGIIAYAVFYSIKPLMARLVRIMNKESMSDEHVNAIIKHVFDDDTPQYRPRKKRTPV